MHSFQLLYFIINWKYLDTKVMVALWSKLVLREVRISRGDVSVWHPKILGDSKKLLSTSACCNFEGRVMSQDWEGNILALQAGGWTENCGCNGWHQVWWGLPLSIWRLAFWEGMDQQVFSVCRAQVFTDVLCLTSWHLHTNRVVYSSNIYTWEQSHWKPGLCIYCERERPCHWPSLWAVCSALALILGNLWLR